MKWGPPKAFGKERQTSDGNWTILLSITFKWNSQICYFLFSQVATAGVFLLVQGATHPVTALLLVARMFNRAPDKASQEFG